MKFNETLKKAMLAAIKCKNNVALIGEPGIGKSSFMEDFAEKILCSKCFTLACNQLADKADLTGARLVPYDDNGEQKYKTMFYPHQVIADAVDYAASHPNETPVLFLDEINRTSTDVTSAALSLTTLRKIGSISLPDNLVLVVAGNDKGNVINLDSASISRFIKFNVEPDTDTFLSLDPNLNPYIRSVLTRKPNLVFCKSLDITASSTSKKDDDDDDDTATQYAIEDIISDGEGMLQITTPRTISALSVWLNNMDQADITAMLLTPALVDGVELTVLDECLIGFVGYTNFEVELFSEIQNALNAGSFAANTNVPQKPACYDQLKAAAQTDMVQLQNYINTLNEKQRSASLVYAVYDKADNHVMVRLLCDSLTKLERDDMKMFVNLYTSGGCSQSATGNKSNVDVFFETALGQQFAAIV